MASAIVRLLLREAALHSRLAPTEIPVQINTFYHNFGAPSASSPGGHTESRGMLEKVGHRLCEIG